MGNGSAGGAAPGGDTLKAFLDQGPIVAFIKDEGGRYTYVNPAMAQLFGVTVAEVQGQGAGEWLPRAIAEMIQRQDPQVLATGVAVETVVPIPRPDGSIEHWKIARFPFAVPGGARFVGGLAVNVTDLQHAQTRLAESERRYRDLVENAQGLICTHDMEGRLLSVNQAALTLTGATAEQVIGRYLGDLLCDASRDIFPLYLERINHVGTDAGLMFVRAANGRELAWQYRNVRVEEPGKPPYVLGHAQDVTELRDAQEQLRQLAMTDDLTGLQNRRGFFLNGTRFLADCVQGQKTAALFYLDIDGLKRINDTFGHDAGSAVIASAAEVMKNSFRAADVLARIGGDEFVALATVPPDDIDTVGKRLRWHVQKFNSSGRLPHALKVSIGLATFEPGSGLTLEALLQRADAAMYAQKRTDPLRPAG
jgi:diguanylate cyclase (GGDEF)-like protein/PAS domain S-box-containing protein